MKEKQPSTSDSPKAEPSASSSKEKELCTEEKIERAQELIEKKREAKELEEKEVREISFVYLCIFLVSTKTFLERTSERN